MIFFFIYTYEKGKYGGKCFHLLHEKLKALSFFLFIRKFRVREGFTTATVVIFCQTES